MQTPRSAQPSVDRRDPALDGLRGLAVLLVFFFHYGGGLRAHWQPLRIFGYLAQVGWVGVDIFFALSGFLITRLLFNALDEPHLLRNFFGRRALRILPLYGLALLLSAAAALATGAVLSALKPFLIYAMFLQNIPSLLNSALHAPPPLPVHHLWSLAVEEQFYLLWPFAVLAARTPRRITQMCLAIFALSCLVRFGVFGTHFLAPELARSFAVFLPVRAGALALGGALAVQHGSQLSHSQTGAHRGNHQHPCAGAQTAAQAKVPDLPWTAVATVSLAVFLVTGAYTHTLLLNTTLAYVWGLPAVDIFSVALVALSLRAGFLRGILSGAWLRAPGRISYGMYVFHILLEPVFDHLGLVLTHRASGFAYQGARLVCAFPLSYLVAWLSFRFFEQPLMRLGRRFPQPSALEPGPAAEAR